MSLNNQDGMAEFGVVAGGLVGLVTIGAIGVIGGKELADISYAWVNELANVSPYISHIDTNTIPSQIGKIGFGILSALIANKYINPIGVGAEFGEKALRSSNHNSFSMYK